MQLIPAWPIIAPSNAGCAPMIAARRAPVLDGDARRFCCRPVFFVYHVPSLGHYHEVRFCRFSIDQKKGRCRKGAYISRFDLGRRTLY